MEVITRVPGSCGELVQGNIAGTTFHISCPVDLYSTVRVKYVADGGPGIRFNQEARNVDKTRKAIRKTLEYFKADSRKLRLEVSMQSELIPALGMASSTADITAAIVSTALLLGKEVNLELIKNLALQVEPTDGVFIPGIALFDHLRGKMMLSIGEVPSIPILIFNSGREVETVEFNTRRNLERLNRTKENQVKEACKLAVKGIKENDWALAGRGAGISALANQQILFKPGLEELLEWADEREDIPGINVAHSGSVIGVLLKEEARVEKVKTEIQKNISELDFLFQSRIINGGIRTARLC
ncbi:MAG: kinase [Halanaerobiales bacterium]